MQPVAHRILTWYEREQRELPWRAPGTNAWGVYVSEVMAQQTQVGRVAIAWAAWMERWPTPAALAAATPADVVRQWDRLGYPRRALWMHAAATRMVEQHAGTVPDDMEELLALPGVGEYTASAILAFAYERRVPVLDVNVRRVHARLFDGAAVASGSVTNDERVRALELLPREPAVAARLSQAVMELGAVVCTARTPDCDACPVRSQCVWLAAGSPPPAARTARQSRFAGSDRQCRGAIMQVLRDAHAPVPASALETVWADSLQRLRCLDSLVADGLVVPLARKRFALPQ